MAYKSCVEIIVIVKVCDARDDHLYYNARLKKSTHLYRTLLVYGTKFFR